MDKLQIKEEFLGFIELSSSTGIAIKNEILKQMKNFGLSLGQVRGQGYDGGSNMSGRFNGVQALILEEQPLAVYTHCFSHGLNLCISKVCELSSIRNMVGIVGSVSNFLSSSAKRNKILLDAIEDTDNVPVPKKTKLKAMCTTRWVERHDSIITFRTLFPYIVNALDIIEEELDREISTKAVSFNSSIKRSDFLVSLEIAANLFSFTKDLSIRLQSPQQDLSSAFSLVREVIKIFEEKRNNADEEFLKYFKNATEVASTIGEEIRIPRVCGRQTKRCNIKTSNPEEWFRITIFIPFIDHFIKELNSRFNDRFKDIIPLEGLIPVYKNKYSIEDILKAALIYNDDISANSDLEIQAELQLWKAKWANIENPMPKTAIETLVHCDIFYPNIKILLQIFATITITSATAERSFSSLRRLKNYMRSSMTEDRLNGLAVLHIHKEIPIDIDDVINRFSRQKQRRMKIEDWSKDE